MVIRIGENRVQIVPVINTWTDIIPAASNPDGVIVSTLTWWHSSFGTTGSVIQIGIFVGGVITPINTKQGTAFGQLAYELMLPKGAALRAYSTLASVAFNAFYGPLP